MIQMVRHGFRGGRVLLTLFAMLIAAAAPILGQTEAPNEPLKIALGEKAPDFSLPATNGETIRLSSLAGHTVLIDFYRGYY